jgi:hypothetical protein
MKVYIFALEIEPMICAFTPDRSGETLPMRDKMKWREVTDGETITVDDDNLPDVADAVRKDGFMLLTTKYPPE